MHIGIVNIWEIDLTVCTQIILIINNSISFTTTNLIIKLSRVKGKLG